MHTPYDGIITAHSHMDRVLRLKKFPNSDLLISCSWDSTIKLWNKRNLTLLRTYESQQTIALEVLNGESFASGSSNDITFWSIHNETKLRTINANSSVISLKMISKEILASGQADGTIKLWNMTNFELIKTFYNHNSSVWDMELIDNDTLVCASLDGSIMITNIYTDQHVANLTGHTNRVSALKLISSELIASGSWDEEIILWNLKDMRQIRKFQGHRGTISGLDILDNDTLVSGSWDDTIKIWQISSGQLLRTINTGLDIWSLLI